MIIWKKEYSCNIAEIDHQHKRLFELADQLFDIAQAPDDYDYHDEIVRIFGELSDYTVNHFNYEEQLMDVHGYDPEATRCHKFEHAAFVSKIVRLQREDLDKKQKKVLMDTIMFATDWIEKHILQVDMRYRDFLNSKGVR